MTALLVSTVLTLIVRHWQTAQGWTRRYSYAEASQIIATETGNRLTATSLPALPIAHPPNLTFFWR